MYAALIIGIFIVGYLCIVLEHNLKINKAPIALFMCIMSIIVPTFLLQFSLKGVY